MYDEDLTGHADAYATQKWNEGQIRDCETFLKLGDEKQARETLEDLDFEDGWYIRLDNYSEQLQDFIKENVHPKYLQA